MRHIGKGLELTLDTWILGSGDADGVLDQKDWRLNGWGVEVTLGEALET